MFDEQLLRYYVTFPFPSTFYNLIDNLIVQPTTYLAVIVFLLTLLIRTNQCLSNAITLNRKRVFPHFGRSIQHPTTHRNMQEKTNHPHFTCTYPNEIIFQNFILLFLWSDFIPMPN